MANAQVIFDATGGPTKIPPEMLKPICNAIGDQFSFAQLDAIIYRCFGDHKINDFTNPSLPPREIAYACVTALEGEGLIVVFLSTILASVSTDSALYALIVKAVPEANPIIPKIEAQIPDVLTGLVLTNSRISDPAAKAALNRFRGTLQSVQYWINLLDCYKSLHDCLHTVLLRPYAALLASVRAWPTDVSQLDGLREYQDQVRMAVTLAKTIEVRLPAEGEGVQKAIESKWIGDLDEAVNIYRKGLMRRDAATARVGVIKMAIVLKDQSYRLNDLIVNAANKLPLAELEKALVTTGGNDPARFPEIAKAITALHNLQTALRSRVAEHDLWQEVDKGIWYLDQLFIQSADPVEDFTVFWPEVRMPSRALADLSPGADWSTALLESSAQVDDTLLRCDAARATPADKSALKSSLTSSFGAFRSDARMRFFVVDQLLKQDCAFLVSIGAPVTQILRSLD